MIPKTLHYCWFGRRPLPKLARRCIASWRGFCPDYEIVQWNEDSFDPACHPYIRRCAQSGQWAFLSDLARLMVVERYGGVYLDTDVELIAPIDPLLRHEAFYAFENERHVATGLGFGAQKGHATVRAMIAQYDGFTEGSALIGCPRLNTQALLDLGLQLNGAMQQVQGALILPADYMNPYDDPTGRLTLTGNTISIHWYMKSALSRRAVLRSRLTRPLHRILGKDCFAWLEKK